ncbi:unnamed protein product [Bemisia tabaci]|uniref:Alpha-mannosidase n=1 Tax=Bemisia tabaci TaxID=7038 RepID=A0A9P0F3U0_BEMTA|nr:unnamed protein product [Bemisia tabaci]
MLRPVLLISVLSVLVHSRCLDNDPFGADQPPKCGYDSCPKPKPGYINVHLVPHTHDDVGWLKTVDQYYYGINNLIQDVSVEYIIDSVVDELKKDPEKKFIYVETAFFWHWWTRQTEERQQDVKKLVADGQLEFIGGAWSMNDEAVTNYMSIIDQFTWGLRKLNDTFGNCGHPKVGWQIDPFGHSKEQASLFAQLGFDGFFMGRIDYQDKRHRLKTKDMEMIWQASQDLGSSSDIFSHILYNTYSPPDGFCFDILCSENQIVDDRNSPEYNLDKMLTKFFQWVSLQKSFYKSSNIILTMGNDFTYQYAHSWYKNMDILIREGNKQQSNESAINIFYSTPSCYLKAVHDEKLSYSVKDDDFFPYASDPHSYWTGYFTSRPTIKFYERMGNNYMQVCKQLSALNEHGPEEQVELNQMRSAMGVMQHHDAITGTEKQHVAADYARQLAEGFAKCDLLTSAALNKLMKLSPHEKQVDEDMTEKPKHSLPEEKLSFQSCNLLNISSCPISERHSRFVVTVYNPQSQNVSKYVRLPIVNQATYTVYDPEGKILVTQIVPIHPAVLEIPGRSALSQATHELIFQAEDVPPLGYKSYYVSHDSSASHNLHVTVSSDQHMSNDKVSVKLDPYNGPIKGFVKEGYEVDIDHSYYYYQPMVGNNEIFANRSSGAYIFRPNGTARVINDKPARVLYKGLLVNELHVTYSNWTSEVVRLYANEHFVEFEWLVGPIPMDQAGKIKFGKEIISRFDSNIESNGTFYTDSNGRQLLKRTLNARPSWDFHGEEDVSSNYYPVTSRIVINDANVRLAVITDRAQGGSSLGSGQVELMVHRRLSHDDAFGVGEALNEEAFGKALVVRGTHYVTVGTNLLQPQIERQLEISKMIGPWIFFTPVGDVSYSEWSQAHNMQYSGLVNALPENVQILTLEPWKERSLLLRLEHIYQKDEDPINNATTVDLQKLFKPFRINSVKETTLGANQWSEESSRLKWLHESNQVIDGDEKNSVHQANPAGASSDYQVVLHPMQIRTFIVDVSFLS